MKMESDGKGKGVILEPLPAKEKRCIPGKYWCGTLNNYTKEEMETLESLFRMDCQFIIGKEIGEEGTPHLQMYVETNIPVRPIEKFKNKRIHWEKRKGTREHNIAYCSKEGKYISNFEIEEKIIDPIEGKTLKDWQKYVINITSGPISDRYIYWLWESEGGVGKTSLAKHLVLKHNALFVNGNANDMKCAIVDWKKNTGKWPKIILMGFPRDQDMKYISYAGMEEIKDGMFFSGKYESGMVCMNNPHIICFANAPPQEYRMTPDKWKIFNIGKDKCLTTAEHQPELTFLDDTLENPLEL